MKSGRVSKKKTDGNSKNTLKASSLKGMEVKRKQVYKPILDNPYIKQDNWPYIDRQVGADIVDLLCSSLVPIGNYKEYASSAKDIEVEKPELESFATLGFNSTNKALEDMSKFNRKVFKTRPLQIDMVFVCKPDIVPDILTKHLPLLCSMASTPLAKVKLIQLPRGSMQRISEVLHTKNTSIIGLSSTFSGVEVLKKFVFQSVTDIDIPWVQNFDFQQPNQKLLVTTQPIVKKNTNPKKAKTGL